MDEKKAFDEALSLAMKEAARITGSSFSLERDIETINRWVTCSGKTWAVKRIKDLKTIALRILSDGSCDLSHYNGRKTVVRGVEIPALRIFSILLSCVASNNWKGIRSVLDVLNIYQVFRGPGDDIEEKIDTITSPYVSEFDMTGLANIKASIVKHFPLRKRSRPWKLAFKGPDIGGARYAAQPGRNSSSVEALIPSLSYIPRWIWESVPKIKDWIGNQPYLENVSRYSRGLFRQGSAEPSPYWAGNLAILGESGLKTRIVFVGNPWIQGCLKPIMVLLQRELLKLGTDCTFDQDKGRDFVRQKLEEGHTVHSVDLSAATDNFPYFLQAFVGELCGIPTWGLDLMAYAGFYHPCKKEDKLLKYGKGQPMGLYPSFCLFALTHNVVLHGLAGALKIDPNSSFRVLGDDVVIADDLLANEYLKVLEVLQVPISKSKTFASSTLGEFAGSVFWKGRDITPIKWRQVTASSINVVSQYIDRGLVVMDLERQKVKSCPLTSSKVYPIIEALYPVPKELGGLGQLTRDKISDRLHWGRRKVRSLRAGYLSLFSERIYRFLSPQELKGIDVTKFAGLVDQQVKFTDLIERAREEALKRPPGAPMPWIMGAPQSKQEDDLPSTREGLKGLESLVFSKDTLEERLGKYHAWYLAKLGPNPEREFNRLITMTGEAVEALHVPILSVSDTKALWARVRHLHPNEINSLFDLAQERLAMLRRIKHEISGKPDSFDDDIPWGKLAATAAATLVNPLAGALTAGVFLMTGEKEDKPVLLDKLVPVLMV